jgi:hypothetical protein
VTDTTTTTRTPAEELRDAATRIRETHAALTALAARTDIRGPMFDLTEWPELFSPESRENYSEVNAWIALANPALADPIAEWLETEAHMIQSHGLSPEGHSFHALRVARVINGH